MAKTARGQLTKAVMSCLLCDGDVMMVTTCSNGFYTCFCQTCKSRIFMSALGYTEAKARKLISHL